MSLLLALTDTGGGGVTGTAVTSQAQSIIASGVASVNGVDGTVSTSQAQTIAASGSHTALGVSGNAATSQVQTVAGTGVASVLGVAGTVSTSQAQTVSGAGSAVALGVSGTASTSQAQTIASSGSFAGVSGVSGVASTSQAQTSIGAGSFVESVAPSFSGEVILQRKKIYVKRGKQYLIFNNNEEADSYLAAEQAIETAKKSSRGAAKRVIKALKVVKPEVIQEPKLDELSELIAKFNVDYDLIQAQKNNDIEALIAIQSMLYRLQQDEEDIELLLLSV